MEGREYEHAQLCALLTAEGYDVVMLPVILGNSGTLFKYLKHAIQELRCHERKLKIKVHLHSISSKIWCHKENSWKDKAA